MTRSNEHCEFIGHDWEETRQGRFFRCLCCDAKCDPPRHRVPAWRKPNEDGASAGVVKTRELRLVGLGRILYSDAEMAEHFRLQDQRNADIMRAIR